MNGNVLEALSSLQGPFVRRELDSPDEGSTQHTVDQLAQSIYLPLSNKVRLFDL